MGEFILKNISIKHHDKSIINVCFYKEDNVVHDRGSVFSSLVLGINGSGKSFLLKIIAEVFIYLEKAKAYKRKPKFRYEQFDIEYRIDDCNYRIERISGANISCYCDGTLVNLEQVIIPAKVLAVSFLVSDKFLFSNSKNDPANDKSIMPLNSYTYLGVRKTTNATFTRSIAHNVMRNIIEIASDKRYDKLFEILSFLKYDASIALKFRINSLKDFERELLLGKFYDTIMLSKQQLEFHIFLVQNKHKILEMLDNKIISISEFYFFKNNEKIPFDDCSSGEKHLLFSLSGILCNIKPTSLVLIDEPEISLHPEWQTQYIGFIKNLFSSYCSCHFIIASHSHYLVSDLEPKSSSLIFLKRSEDDLSPIAEILPFSTYTWSAENVIYNIFGVRTTRNYYFESELRKLIQMINEDDASKNIDEINRLIMKIDKLIYDTDDPLNLIIKQAKEFCDVYKEIE